LIGNPLLGMSSLSQGWSLARQGLEAKRAHDVAIKLFPLITVLVLWAREPYDELEADVASHRFCCGCALY
jgi:hypothetical protein